MTMCGLRALEIQGYKPEAMQERSDGRKVHDYQLHAFVAWMNRSAGKISG